MLYNALRMHKIRDPSIQAEDWQVWDYRQVPLDSLFELLAAYQLHLDRESFIAYADLCDSPEDLTDSLIGDTELTEASYDQIFLVLFELWRRLVPEKRCLTVFCDELDHEMYLYDAGLLDNPEPLEDAIGSLKQVLEDVADEGEDPKVLFEEICNGCAYDIEAFLFDFISERIEHGNLSYAGELIDDFIDYVKEPKWFQLLEARFISAHSPMDIENEIEDLAKKASSEDDFTFVLEVLPFLIQEGDSKLFLEVARRSLNLLKTEEDFIDLLCLCADYFQCMDNEAKEQEINTIMSDRGEIPFETPFDPNDEDIKKVKKVLRAT